MRTSYRDRSAQVKNGAAKRLLELMENKQTNLCLSLDVTDKNQFLRILKEVGPEICLLKTHIDTLVDFDDDFVQEMLALAGEHRFMIFEDRKFADIGNTVKKQYSEGVYHIVEWSDITNAHIVPGPGIIEGLREAAEEFVNGGGNERGLLLLAEMSSEGSLAVGEYTQTAYTWAQQYDDFVIGFIGKGSSDIPQQMIVMTPGVNMNTGGDALGQQYQTPQAAITAGTDVIIVGRGIYEAENPAAVASEYRSAGWEAYLQTIQ